ncbi:hypothetical protein BSKO_11756 [Bryopsis sp. KO-2023]|nr:hypothetical protein BSKO_11756 [Bryopsis sp. KO-2023]
MDGVNNASKATAGPEADNIDLEDVPSPFLKLDDPGSMESDPDALRGTLPRLAIPPAGIHPVVAPKSDQEEEEDYGIEPLQMFEPVIAGPPRSSKSIQLSHPVDPKVEEWNKALPRRNKRSNSLPPIPRPPTTPPNTAPNASNLTFAPHSPEAQPSPLLGTWSANLMGDS